ncbi:Bug family tripartite tricarboxylate transporter substrate binding protein [Cupriavidus taiwanensis]|uniref:Bug family tripartite tricarboxylate transporter substrate binding protein n=1 Tax=Cupriavidus taiwanensis TaxID=164546 RepID=UPI0039C11411
MATLPPFLPHLSACLIGVLCLAPAGAAFAQDWPAKPVTLVVPFPAGGGTDLLVRTIQPRLQAALGQPVVIDNRSGAGGTIGATFVARAAPDGYVVGVATTSTHAVSASVYPRLPYKPVADFAYAGFIGTSPYVLAVNRALQAPDVKTLLDRLRHDKPAQHSFASVGVGTVSHLIGVQFQALSRVPLTHVPYRGAAPAYTDLIGGQVQLMFDNPAGLVPYLRAGKLVAVATTAPTPLLPNVPTFASQGVPGFAQQLWYGLAFPRGTPAPIVARMNQALNQVLADKDIIRELADKGVTVRPGTPAEMLAAVQHDLSYWGGIARSVGATLE